MLQGESIDPKNNYFLLTSSLLLRLLIGKTIEISQLPMYDHH